MWGDNHPLPYNSQIKERLIGRFSFGQSIWIATGIYMAVKMSKNVPTIPFIDNFIVCRIHYLLPIAVAIFFGFAKHNKTGLMFGNYLGLILRLRFKRRKFLYRKKNIREGGDY
ncbi:hypothetical protein LJR153_007320 [Paenibacillus sp. LjRoot153]|uniref:hypothetical protein n=1 Tax=Paenibacillus sp. LjRoot153 TaxID=3342270 RepID=UPI003ED0F796